MGKLKEKKKQRDEAKAMKCVLGMVGDGFALVVTDTSSVYSILTRTRTRSPSSAWGEASGESGRRVSILFHFYYCISFIFVFLIINYFYISFVNY